MLFPDKMCEIAIIVHKSHTETLLDEIHERGYLQLFECENSTMLKGQQYMHAEPQHKRLEVLSELIMQTTKLSDILKKYQPKPKGLYRSLIDYRPVERAEINREAFHELHREARSILESLDYINSMESERSDLVNSVNNLKLQIEKIKLFHRQKIRLEHFQSTKNIVVRLGLTSSVDRLTSEIYGALSEKTAASGQYAIYIQPSPGDHERYIAVIIIPYDEHVNVRKVFSGRFFEELELGNAAGTPDEILGKLRTETENSEKKIKVLTEKLSEAAERHFQRLSVLHERLYIARKAASAQNKFGQTASTSIICGWCLKRNVSALEKLCDEVTGRRVVIKVREADQREGDDAPVKMNNPKWAQPFEMLTTTFAHPKYSEIDPTVIIAPLFVLFFGIMLGDAGYGILIIALSIFGYRKLGRGSLTFRNLSYLGLWVGTATLIAGFLMGSFFGDLIPRFFYKDPDALLYNASIAGISLPYDSFRNPMLLFQISLIVGLLIINLGIVLGAMQSIRKRDSMGLVSKQLSWFVIQPPAILLLGYFLLDLWELSGGLLIIASITLLIGISLLSLQYTLSYKALTMFDITGFLGDWLSFVRLLALALATIGMALTFNIMGELILNAGNSQITFAVTIIIASIFLIFTHLINLGLQTLGASIHSLRLQYIELFNRCYEGGGSPFKPFYAKRTYTKIKRVTEQERSDLNA